MCCFIYKKHAYQSINENKKPSLRLKISPVIKSWAKKTTIAKPIFWTIGTK